MEFDARNNILRVTIEGRVTDAILLDCYAAIALRMRRPIRRVAAFLTSRR